MNQIVKGNGGLEKLVIDTPAARGEMYLNGAHVTHFEPRGQRPVLFMSKDSSFAPDKPIRGGIPICFPWFGPHANDKSAPMHGFARISQWKLKSSEAYDDGARVVMSLESNDTTRKLWIHEFVARLTATFTKQFELELDVTNSGRLPFTYQEALHTYLSVGDARQITIAGLSGVTYFDKVAKVERVQDDLPIRITGETDRVYLNTRSTCVVEDPVFKRNLAIEKSGSDVTVVWNPWKDRAAAMPDFGDDEWPGMVCVETANTGSCSITLAPGESHSIRAVVKVS